MTDEINTCVGLYVKDMLGSINNGQRLASDSALLP